MLVEGQPVEQHISLSNRIKQHPISQRFLRVGASIALAFAALAPDNVSTFIKPASAAESTTIVPPTWRNRCGPNTHIPFTDQSLLYSEYSVVFLVSSDTQQYLSTYQEWHNNGVDFLVQRIDGFNLKRIGTRTSWDRKTPIVRNMPNTFATYKNNVGQFVSDLNSQPVTAKSTPEKAAKEMQLYVHDPNLSIDELILSLGAWGGPYGKAGSIILPGAVIKPTLSAEDKEFAARIAEHEDNHINTKNLTDPQKQGHDADPKDIMYRAFNMAVPEDEVFLSDRDLVNTCPPGDPDPDISNLKTKLYLAVTIKN